MPADWGAVMIGHFGGEAVGFGGLGAAFIFGRPHRVHRVAEPDAGLSPLGEGGAAASAGSPASG
jgi:hypothetical protein